MNEPMPWAEELRVVIGAIDECLRSLDALHAWTWHAVVADDVFPKEMPEPADLLFKSLYRQLADAQKAASEAFDRYSSGPVERLFMKQPLSREDYFLLQAMGATQEQLPRTPWSPPGSGSVPPAG